MVITFVSNYINHHQIPFCEAMSAIEGVDFKFIQVMPMEQKRVDMGWAVDPASYPYVLLYYKNSELCEDLILGSDIVIFGWTQGLISDIEKKRLSSGRLSFRVSERIYRNGQWKAISPRGLINKYREHIRYRDLPVYLLCAGAYVASDFALIKSYPGKMLKWGYFPGAKEDRLRALNRSYSTKQNKLRLCWAGRFIKLKHPEFAIEAAKMLRARDVDFTLDMIGDGTLKRCLEREVKENRLGDRVVFHGNLKPHEVPEKMAEADVFLFTSNYLEGWGAVVNEAMMSGCCVLASKEAGAVPFLIEDGVNGFSYDEGSLEEFLEKLSLIADSRDKIPEIGKKAYETIADTWNADVAAKEFIRFTTEFYKGMTPRPAKSGPMSVAEIIKPPGIMRTQAERNVLE